jgi:predicted transcriptional regulator
MRGEVHGNAEGAETTMVKNSKGKPDTRVAKQLKAAIRSSGMTVYEIAKRAEIEPDSLYKFLKGDRDMYVGTLGSIANVLGLELKPISK